MISSRYPTAPLSTFCRVQSGYTFKSADWVDAGVPVVQIKNVRDRRIDLDNCKHVTDKVALSASKFRLNKNYILIAMTGQIGVVGKFLLVDEVIFNQRVGRF